MLYLRGDNHEFLSSRKRHFDLSKALYHGTGNLLYVYDNENNLLKIIELKGSISFDHIYEATNKPWITENLYEKWADEIILGGEHEGIQHHVTDKTG